MKKKIFYLILLCISIIVACKTYNFRTNYNDANILIHDSAINQTKLFLKTHLKNGDIIILKDTWKIDTISNKVTGYGTRYDFNRKKIYEGIIFIPIDSVSIFETNKKLDNSETSRIAAITILTSVDVTLGIMCLTNPKACFGSCPTFYINENDNFHYADAEGFSNAIAPSLEYSDIDALNNSSLNTRDFSLTMKNEALETHCLNEVILLAYPRKKGERVYQTRTNDFYLCKNNYALSESKSNKEDNTLLLQKEDRKERFSTSDENNLSSKEEIYLSFNSVEDVNNLGLLVNFRQSLMTTYFIYSAIGYMGNEVSDIFAGIEKTKDTKSKLDGGLKKELGDIDIYQLNSTTNAWEKISGLYETGPIAINRQLVALKNISSKNNVKLKVVLNKGLWRMDYVSLTNIKEKVEPIEINTSSILNKGELDNSAMRDLNSTKNYLISMPGSEYKFNFKLPEENTDYELFLYSKGYYLEWMREHWIKDKDLLKLFQMVNTPKKYLKDEAKNYKKYEADMEQAFWNSKIDTKLFSYYDEK
jgi:hypothetical protein